MSMSDEVTVKVTGQYKCVCGNEPRHIWFRGVCLVVCSNMKCSIYPYASGKTVEEAYDKWWEAASALELLPSQLPNTVEKSDHLLNLYCFVFGFLLGYFFGWWT